MCRRQPTVVYDDQSWLLLLLIDYAEAVKHTDIQNMIKAVNIKDNTKNTKKTYNGCSKCLPHRLLDKDTELSNR